MRKHDLTNKKTMTKTSTMTMTKTMTNTFREHLQRAIFETFELWDIWSEWWGNMTWPTKRQQRRQTQWQWQKFRVWPLIHCYESDSSRPNWWGLTKIHNLGQISQSQSNFTILEYMELGQFGNFWFGQVHDSNTSTERWMEDLTRSWMPPLLVSRQLGGTPRSSSTVSPLILFWSATFYTWCTKPVFNQKK